MNERDMLRWTCRRIREKFKSVDAYIDPYYNFEERKNGPNQLSVDVTLKFTIPQKNIALLDGEIDQIRNAVKELTDGEE